MRRARNPAVLAKMRRRPKIRGESSGGVRVTVSPIQRPGAVMSGDVVFSDGGLAEWVLDNSGRLGLNPSTPGYTPPQSDLPEFQQKLREALGV